MARAVVTRPTARPEAEGKLVCHFLTALQILLQPLPQPLCRNERSRTSSSRRRSISHCPSGTSLETRRMNAPWVKVQPSVNYSPEGRRGEKNYDGPTVKDHRAFWALPPWLMESLVIPSQLSTGVLQDQGDR